MIRTYSDLLASVAEWLDRGDLAPRIPEFVQLAEAEMTRVLRRRVVRATLAVAGATTNLPADCVELRSISLVSGTPHADLPIRVGTMERLAEVRARYGGAAGRPVQAAVIGGQLLVAPAPDTAYDADVTYFERLVPLGAGATSNSVLEDAPDVYLWGALLQAAPYLQHDERIPVWREKFDRALTQLNVAREREESAASLRPARLPVVF